MLTERDREYFDRVCVDMSDNDATLALYQLSDFLYRYYGKKVIIPLDEYDTPMQEAYVDGYSREDNEPSDCLKAFGDCPRAHGSENHERDELVGSQGIKSR